jgi:hypothetical protein
MSHLLEKKMIAKPGRLSSHCFFFFAFFRKKKNSFPAVCANKLIEAPFVCRPFVA